jgi:Putative peptidoglycan binding domain
MLEQRFSAGDRLSGPAAVAALLACFAVVLSPSFVASLILIASEKPWGVASPTAPPVKSVGPVLEDRSEDVRTGTAHVSPAPPPDEAAGGALFPSIALRSTELPNIEPAAANEVSPVADREAVEAAVPAARITESAAPERDLRQAHHIREIQERLVQLGYLSVQPTGVWGTLSRQALKAFKEAHQLDSRAEWDAATERSLFAAQMVPAASFVGIWGADASACSARLNRKGLLPAVIDDEGAFAGETSCAFKSRKQVAGAWQVVAACGNARSRWTANVRLAVAGNRLTWSSQRGSQTYVRCERDPMMADASR